MSSPFDPTKHIMQIRGKDYLETKWRLVWLRDTYPNASVQTELVRADERGVTIRAEVSWPVVMHEADDSPLHIVRNTGYAMEPWEKPNRIGAALENAETSALGRALAAAGFGTQFAPELDFDSGGDRVADSPVERPQARQKPHGGRYAAAAANAVQDAPEPVREDRIAPRAMNPANADEPATQPQIKALFAIGRKLNIQVNEWVAEQFGGRKVDDLTRAEASLVIEDWQKELDGVPV